MLDNVCDILLFVGMLSLSFVCILNTSNISKLNRKLDLLQFYNSRRDVDESKNGQ